MVRTFFFCSTFYVDVHFTHYYRFNFLNLELGYQFYITYNRY